MLELASEITICLLLAALIGFALGYLLGKNTAQKIKPETGTYTEENNKKNNPEQKKEEPTPIEESHVEEITVIEDNAPADDIEIPTDHAIERALEALEAFEEQESQEIQPDNEEEQKPKLLSQPRNNKKDDLTQIKGIGPKVEEKLNAAGIFHFDQIANWTEDNLVWLETHTPFTSRVKKEAWRKEAKSLL